MPKLKDDVRDALETPIKIEEVGKAIDDLSKGKSPGPDGIGAGFYKTFKNETTVLLYRVITEAYEVKQLPLSFRASHIILIPKTEDAEKL